MAYERPTAVEIDKKLREDFRRRLKDFGISAETTDPVLAVLFRTLAGQLETLYSETGRIRLALLDELIAGLGIEPRRARPAQTVIRFLPDRGPEWIEAGTELLGEAQSGERLTFATDANITVSSARIALAATYQEGELQLLPAVELPEEIQSARPSLDPVRVNLGANPAIFLALENLPESHLGRHGFFFELGPDAEAIQRALLTETWCLAGPDGEMGARGILRPKRINAGVRQLEWLVRERASSLPGDGEKTVDAETPALPDGFYAGRVLVFPGIPPSRRFVCQTPRAMETAWQRIFGKSADTVLAPERAWVRISMPKDVPSLHTAIGNISLHAISASNVECFNETIRFEEQGTTIPVSKEAGTSKHLVAPLSIFGEGGTTYLSQFDVSADPRVGRFRVHNGELHLQPARRGAGEEDAYANVRIWLTAGTIGNSVGPGALQAFLKRGTAPPVRIVNPTAAAGGTGGESFQQAQDRFAAALLSRDRIVTRADLESVVRAFDRRIRDVSLFLGVERTPQGLQRVHRVRCQVERDDFVEPDEEVRILREELADHLRQRFLFDVGVSLAIEAS